jgi:hypothetical protein
MYFFTLFAEDAKGNRSSTITFPISVLAGSIVTVSGILFAPTIDVDKSVVRRGETITVFGVAQPKAEVSILVGSDPELTAKTTADLSGAYLQSFDTTLFALGDHSTRSKSSLDGEVSQYSRTIGFLVSTSTIYKIPPVCHLRADLNGDCRVNLVDFSIMAYWYRRPNPPTLVDLSGDRKIDLQDFSILAYHWTG